MSNQKLVFDITKIPQEQIPQQLVVGRVGDGGLKAVDVSLIAGNRPYSLQGLKVIFEGLKPDGTRLIDTTGGLVVDAQGGIFRYLFPTQAFRVKGKYEQAFFKIVRGEQVDTTLEFQMNVLENKVEWGLHSEDYLTEYQELIHQLQGAFDETLQKLKETSEATKEEIEAQKATVDAISERVKMLLDKIQTLDLATEEEVKNIKTVLEQEVNLLRTSMVNLESRLGQNMKQVDEKVTKLSSTALSRVVSATPIPDVAQIKQTGFYYYDNKVTKNLPTLSNTHANGYVFAVMKDENYGSIALPVAGMSIEKYKGALFGKWRTAFPAPLWEGKAKKGATLSLTGSLEEHTQVMVKAAFVTNGQFSQTYVAPGTTKFYLNQVGIPSNGQGIVVEEVRLSVVNDKTIHVDDCLLSNGTNAQAAESVITGVYGLY